MAGMMVDRLGPPVGPDEAHRIADLVDYKILDSPPEEAFDDLAALAAVLVGTPIALVTFVDADRQWFKSTVGLSATQTPRCDSFCAWAIATPDEIFVVPDAVADPRFTDNPLVTGDPKIRFYAGAPIRSHTGRALGTLCVIDPEPRAGLSPVEEQALSRLARQVGKQLELRRVAQELARSEARSNAMFEYSSDIIIVLDVDGTVDFANAALERILGWHPNEKVGTHAFEMVHPDDLAVVGAAFARTVTTVGSGLPLSFRAARSDGTWVEVESVSNNRLDDPDICGVVVQVRDVSLRKEIEQRVRRSEEQLADAQLLAGMGSMEHDLRSGALVWSEGLFRLYGLDSHSVSPSMEASIATMHPDERGTVVAALALAEATGQPYSFRRRIMRPDGTVRVAITQGEVDLDPEGRPVRMREALFDITAQAQAEEALNAERKFLQAVLDSLEEGIVACDAEGTLTLFNPATERLHGLPLEGLAPESWARHYDLYAADGVTPLSLEEVPLFRALHGSVVDNDEMVVVPKQGGRHLLRCKGQAIFDDAGTKLGAVVAMHDITDQRRNENSLRRLADHDRLTDLPNRAVFSSRLDVALLSRSDVAVLFVDLDDFKRINDEYGHNVGDRVLATVASRLRAAVKGTDTPARIGGDEFVVLCLGVSDHRVAEAITARLTLALAEPITVDGVSLKVGASVGYAMPQPGQTADGAALLVEADHAMYAAKRGRCRS
ncbi:MAG: PAS domain S-box protein [Acidimicrobiales bacterium]